jgi:hypothetical protein
VAGRDAVRDLVLIAVAFFQQAHRCYSRQQPGQLGDFRHIGLFPEDRLLWVEAAGKEVEGHIERVLAAFGGVGYAGLPQRAA